MVISHSLTTLLADLSCLDFEDPLDGLYRPPDFDNVEPSAGYQLTPLFLGPLSRGKTCHHGKIGYSNP